MKHFKALSTLPAKAQDEEPTDIVTKITDLVKGFLPGGDDEA